MGTGTYGGTTSSNGKYSSIVGGSVPEMVLVVEPLKQK